MGKKNQSVIQKKIARETYLYIYFIIQDKKLKSLVCGKLYINIYFLIIVFLYLIICFQKLFSFHEELISNSNLSALNASYLCISFS